MIAAIAIGIALLILVPSGMWLRHTRRRDDRARKMRRLRAWRRSQDYAGPDWTRNKPSWQDSDYFKKR